MRLSGPMRMSKPTSAARARIISRFWADCSGVEPYLRPICSTMFSPSGAICGFSSKGWKAMSAATPSPFKVSSAVVSPPRPTAHQGQTTSETKSIFRVFSGAGAASVMGERFLGSVIRTIWCC
ncbi:hypothetical protein D3C80_1092200 [compost metagenome]